MTFTNISWDEAEAALLRLSNIAGGHELRSEICANFILGWWDHHEHKSFLVNKIWHLDPPIADDVRLLINFVSEHPGLYPNEIIPDEYLIGLSRHWEKIKNNREA